MSEQVAQRAARAKAFLDDEIVRDIFVKLDSAYWDVAKSSPLPAVRAAMVDRAVALDELQRELRIVAEKGAIQKAEIERKARATAV